MKKFLILLILPIIGFSQEYTFTKDSQRQKGTPQGTVTKHEFRSSLFANTVRDYYVYIPAQYDASKPAALMIFQDGHAYVNEKGSYKTPIVFDNLIHQGKMPVTIGLFINPGHDESKGGIISPWKSSNRSVEYDSMNDDYTQFLIKEMIPLLQMQYNISNNPRMKAIGGVSSGGICAFTAAWEHPEVFQKVHAVYGSFTNIRGGHNYPTMIRKTDRKDLKVFLYDGSNDLSNDYGDWWLANLQMDSALRYKEYNYRFVTGNDKHGGPHAGSVFPETLEWMWSDVMTQKEVVSGVYKFDESKDSNLMMRGETPFFDGMDLHTVKIESKDMINSNYYDTKEQIFIIKEGKVEITIEGKTKIIGANSVAFVLPKDRIIIKNISDKPAVYYQMIYSSKEGMNLQRGKDNSGSFIIDFDDLEYKTHNKGGIRNYFKTSTAMLGYYDIHVTNLNAGIKSHEPHTHRATEIILMIKGNTQMEIGDKIYKGNTGDIYFVSSEIPHAIENIGDEQCMYFAFQWGD